MNNVDKQTEDEFMWKKYGFHIRYEKLGNKFERRRYFTQGLVYSKGINDFELEDRAIDVQTAKYIFIDLVYRIDNGEEIEDGTIFDNILGLYRVKFSCKETNGNIKILMI